MREISGTIEFNRVITNPLSGGAGGAGEADHNEPYWNELIQGLQVNGSSGSPAISLNFVSDDPTNESLEINLYKVQFEAPETNLSGRDTQTMSVSFYCLFDETEGAMPDAVWTTSDNYDVTA